MACSGCGGRVFTHPRRSSQVSPPKMANINPRSAAPAPPRLVLSKRLADQRSKLNSSEVKK